MITEFLQPPRYIVVCLMLADIVDKERTNGTSVVRGSDGSIALLSCCVPNLCFDRFRVNLDGSRGKFDTDGRLGVEVELVSCESTQKIRFANTGVTDKHD